jgi:glutaredoxin-related protein
MALNTALSSTTNIPEDVYNDVQAAKAKLAYSLRQTPVDMTNYNQAIALIDSAINELGTIDIREGMEALTAAGAAAAFDILFKGLQGVIKERLRAERDARNKFQSLYTVIVGTRIESSSNSAALARPAKALSDLGKVSRDMTNSSLTQSVMIPQYLLTLGAIKQVLKLSSPIEEDPSAGGAVYTNQSITFDFAPTNNLTRVLARIFTFTRSPSNTSYLSAAVADAKTYYLQLEAEYADFETQVNSFLTGTFVAPVVDLINNVASYLDDAGLDAAKSALESGDLESLLAMDEFTGTTYGQAYAAIEDISRLAYKYNLFDIKTYVDKMKKQFQKKAESKKMDNDSKKKEKLAKLKATIEGALSTIDELVTIGEEVAGMIDAITAITVS